MLITLLYMVFIACAPEPPSYEEPTDSADDTTAIEDTGDPYADAACEYSERVVDAEYDVGLGYTALEAAETLSGERAALVDWLDWEERSELRIRLDVSAADAWFYESVDDGCEDYLALTGVMSLDTEDGWLQEEMPVSLRLLAVDHAWLEGHIDWLERGGAYTPADLELDLYSGLQLFVAAETGEDGDIGYLSITGDGEEGSGFIFETVSCWGPEGCVEEALR